MVTIPNNMPNVQDLADAMRYAGIGLNQGPAAPLMGSVKINRPGVAIAMRQDEYHRMLAMRMRWVDGNVLPLQHISIHVTEKVAFVFVVQNDKAVTLEDDPNMFPSDQLITQLRIIQG